MAEQKTRYDIAKAIMEKSVRDDAFRSHLVADSKGTLVREIRASTGQEVKLPDHVTVTVHEETLENIHLAMPAKVTAAAELSDAQLEQAAGGVFLKPQNPQRNYKLSSDS